jgi:hypothetical protein
MKYIKLYEAFESDIMTETIKFLTKKIGKSHSQRFKERIKKVKDNFNLPIDKISDSDIVYTSKTKAIKIVTDEPINNRLNLYCLKFWFSLEAGLLGTTAIANKNYINEHGNEMAFIGDEIYDEDDLDYIKEEIGLETGKLSPVNLRDVKNGDRVVIKLANKYICEGLIFIEENYSGVYVLQNATGGSAPDGDWRDKGFSYAWKLGRNINRPGDDFSKLCLYTESDEPLNMKVDYKFRNNILLTSNLRRDNWDSESDTDVINKADFCIVLYLDRLSKLEDTSITKKNRYNSREDALALTSDQDIKKANIKRYTAQMFKLINIKPESIDLTKISKIISNIVLGNNSFLYISSDSNSLYQLNGFIEHLYNLFRADDDDKQHYYDDLIDFYDRCKNQNGQQIINSYDNNVELISKLSDDSIKTRLEEIHRKYIQIGAYINNYIKDGEYESIDDILILFYKLDSIKRILNNDNFRIDNYTIRSMISSFTDSIRYKLNSYDFKDELKEYYPDAMTSLEKQFRYVKSALK